MNEIATINEEKLYSKIYNIRGKQVMLDSDLAKIYGYTTTAFNQQVKRNIEKFNDEDFMFQLTDNEFMNLMSQNVISSWGGRRKLPHCFTEQGIYMLMTVLKGELATKQSKTLIMLFKKMKDFVIYNNNFLSDNYLLLQTNENTKTIDSINKQIIDIKNDLNKLKTNFINNDCIKEIVILNNHIYEADIAYINIFKLAKKCIYIIDDYIDYKTLSLLSNINKDINIIIFSDNVSNHLIKEVYYDFLKEYNLNITILKTNNIIHDRYIILDYNTESEAIYTSGSSIKDAGSKITSIVKMNDSNVFHSIVDSLLNNDELFINNKKNELNHS